MSNIEDGFSVNVLVLGDVDTDRVLVAQGDFDPSSGSGYEAPIGSLFLRRDSAILYLKTGAPDTGWSTVTAGATDELVKTSSGDGTAGFLSDKIIAGTGLDITESTGGNRTLTLDYTDVDRVQTIYVGKHGNDSNDGLASSRAKLTFGSAITAASSLTPSTTNRISIVCEDGGTYSESFTIPSWVFVKAPNATFEGNITLSDDSEFVFQEATASTGNVLEKATGTGTAWATGEIVRATGSADGLVNNGTTSILIARVRQVFVENGTAILDQSSASGHVHCEIEDLYIEGTGTAVDRQSNNGSVLGKITHILEIGAGVGNGTAIDVTTGHVSLVVGVINTDVAYSVAGAGSLHLVANEIDDNADRIQLSGAATVNVIESNSLRWRNKTANFTAKRTEFVTIDTSSNAITMNLPNPASDGDSVTFQDARQTFETNNLTIDAGAGALIDDGGSGTQTVTLSVNGAAGVLIYSNGLGRWVLSRIQEEVGFSPTNLIYVTKNGDDTVGDGSFSNPFLTVEKGIEEALTRVATTPISTTVKVLDGTYEENNPLQISGTNSEFVKVQGEQNQAIIIEPANTGNLFELESNVTNDGPSLSRMTLSGDATYRNDTVNNNALVFIDGDGRFVLDDITLRQGRKGIDLGNGTISTNQEVVWSLGTALDNATGIECKGTAKSVNQVVFLRENDIGATVSDTSRLELGNYEISGGETGQNGTGIIVNNNGELFANSGYIRNLVTGIEANDTSDTIISSTFFQENTNDFDQVDGTAVVQVQGALSKSSLLIADGANVSLNYINTDDGDFIVGNADSTGTPGKEFRVRDSDGRVAIGDNATNTNMADGAVGGGRALSVIDTAGNVRIWRYVTTDGEDPALELIKGTASATDGAGRPGGPNPGDPAQDVRDGTGTVWWDMFVQEADYLVFRRRTDGQGSEPPERLRIFNEHTEFLGATEYDSADQALMLYLNTTADAVNNIQIDNAPTGNGPEISAQGDDTNIDIEMIPKGTGTVVVPVGYEANIIDQSLITKQYFDDNIGASGDQAVVQARRTTGLSNIPTTWTDLDFDTTDIENDSTVVEHLAPTTEDRIEIKEDGLYEIRYLLTCDDEIQGRIRVNDTTVIAGSEQQSGDPGDVNDIVAALTTTVYADLTAGDFLTVQIQAETTAEDLQADALFQVKRAGATRGADGAPGPAGSGSTINVEDAGTLVPNSPFDTLNFLGATVTDAGGGTVDISLGSVGDQAVVQARRTTTSSLTTTWVDLDFNTTDLESDSTVVEHLAPTFEDRIEVKEDGLYEIVYFLVCNDEVFGRVRVNDSTIIDGSEQRSGDIGDLASMTVVVYADLTANDFLTLQVQTDVGVEPIEADALFLVKRLSGQRGDKGDKGDPGSGSTINVEDSGTLVPNSPFDTINFIGGTVTDAGGGTVDVTLDTTPKQYFHAHNGSTTQSLTGAFVTSLIANDIRSDTIYSNSNGEVTINKTGWFKVEYEVTADATGGGRSSMECKLEQNSTDVPGSFSWGYHRNDVSGETTASATVLINVTSGDTIRVRIREENGGIETIQEGSRLTISEIDDPS